MDIRPVGQAFRPKLPASHIAHRTSHIALESRESRVERRHRIRTCIYPLVRLPACFALPPPGNCLRHAPPRTATNPLSWNTRAGFKHADILLEDIAWANERQQAPYRPTALPSLAAPSSILRSGQRSMSQPFVTLWLWNTYCSHHGANILGRTPTPPTRSGPRHTEDGLTEDLT